MSLRVNIRNGSGLNLIQSKTYLLSINPMKTIKEVRGLKCPNHDYVRDNHHIMYEETYPGAKPLSSTRCIRCGYTMSLHKLQK